MIEAPAVESDSLKKGLLELNEGDKWDMFVVV